MAYSNKGEKLNLTSLIQQDSILKWKAPKGEWRLIALFEGKTLQKVKRAAPGGEGYVMDHLDADAVKIISKNSKTHLQPIKLLILIRFLMIRTKFMGQIGAQHCWTNFTNEEDTSWRTISPNYSIKAKPTVRDASYPTTERHWERCWRKNLPGSGQIGLTDTEQLHVIRRMVLRLT